MNARQPASASANRFEYLLLLQAAVFLFSLGSVLAKVASGHSPRSWEFLAAYGAFMAILAGYAVLWQQVLRHVPLTVAYASKGLVIVWALAWSVLFFGDRITLSNVVGAALIVAGILCVGKE